MSKLPHLPRVRVIGLAAVAGVSLLSALALMALVLAPVWQAGNLPLAGSARPGFLAGVNQVLSAAELQAGNVPPASPGPHGEILSTAVGQMGILPPAGTGPQAPPTAVGQVGILPPDSDDAPAELAPEPLSSAVTMDTGTSDDSLAETPAGTELQSPSTVVRQMGILAPAETSRLTPGPTDTPLPTGHSELQNNELASADIVGKLDPKQSLPPEISDCRWQQPDAARIVCHVQVYLPPGYFAGARRYPVVYLLHGWGGWDPRIRDSEWNLYQTFTIADTMIRAGKLPPLIIVVPEGGHNYWFNHAVDNERWGDYVAAEVVSYVDTNFRTLPQRASRAIGGLSMGGLGAIQLALNHPKEFSVVGMRSPTLRRFGDPDDAPFFGDAGYYADYDPFVLVNRSDAISQMTLYIIIGDHDMWLDRTQEFRDLLDEKEANYEWHVYPGGHDGPFFGSHIDEELAFYGAHLATQ